MHTADLIEEWAEEYRQAGNAKPYTQAEIDFMEYGKDPKSRNVRTIKRVRLRGRQHWRELAQQVHKHPDWAKAVGQSLPSWLQGRK